MILLPLLSDALTPHQLEDFAKRFGVQARGGMVNIPLLVQVANGISLINRE